MIARRIVAYLAACQVAAAFLFIYFLFETDAFSGRPSTDINRIVSSIVLLLGIGGVIGGILTVPWLSMYFVFKVDPTRLNCILFGAICGLLSILSFQIANTERWPTCMNEIHPWHAISPILLFVFAGAVSGATYWVIGERSRT